MDTGSAVPRPFLHAAVVFSSIGVMLFVINLTHTGVGFSGYLVLMVITAVWSEHYAPVIRGHAISIAMPMVVAALTLGGPCAAALVASISAIRRDSFSSRRSAVIALYNFGNYTAVAGAVGYLYVDLGGPVLHDLGMRQLQAADFPQALLPMVVATLGFAMCNVAITGFGVALLYSQSMRDSLANVLPHSPSLIALGFVGYLIAEVVASNVLGLPLFLFPLMLARQLYQRYAAMKDVYIDTVRSLIGALEAKDPYTRGHSVRVSEYATRLGRKLGHDERTLDMLEKSALLHDIGKLALQSSVLLKPTKLTDEEFAAMRLHPALGAAMVDRIPPLRVLTEPVRQHHEWFDGRGYPDGRRSSDIHALSRILAVADAFDAMTTNRAYRPAMDPADAVLQLYQGVGTQFDPALVEPFVEMLHEEGGPLCETKCTVAKLHTPVEHVSVAQ